MPTLLLDIGNTRTKVAATVNRNLILLNKNNRPITRSQIKNWIAKYKLTHLFAANVNEHHQPVLDISASLLYAKPWNKKLRMPYESLYRSNTLGQDRMAMVAAASLKFLNQNSLIISCGTCITYDFLNAQNQYCGGAISPGLKMRFNALHLMTARLPLIKAGKLTALSGATTIESIQSGVFRGIIGELSYQILSYQKKYHQLNIVITGGDAHHFIPHLNCKIFAVDNLVLQGLQQILQHNFPDIV